MGEVTYTDFPFKLDPYKHQYDGWKMSRSTRAFALLPDMGCGKTKILLDTAAYLYLQGEINALVVVAPKGVYLNWVDDQIPTHMSDSVPYRVAYWTSYSKKDDKERMRKLEEPGKFLRILCVNIEAMASEKAVEFLFDFLKKYTCLMAVDESTTIKNPNAKRTRIIINAGKQAKYRRIMTGNPMPNGVMDIYSQYDFLGSSMLGHANFFSFRNRYAIMKEMKNGAKTFKHVVGYKDTEHLKETMKRCSFIIKKEDCLDLPPKTYQVVDVDMGDEQKKCYNKMLADSFILLENGQVSAPLVLTQLVRLHQIACGFLKPDFEDEIPFNEKNDRLETLIENLELHKGKAIIWATYRFNMRQIIDAIADRFGKDSVVHFYGETKRVERYDAVSRFQGRRAGVYDGVAMPEMPHDPNTKYMVSNPQSGRFGNTWTRADLTVYFSNSHNLEHRDQSEERNYRIGQDLPCTVLDLRARGTVDDKILKILKNKKTLSDSIIVSNWQWLLGEKV